MARGGPAAVKQIRSMFDTEREDMRRWRFERLHRVDMQGQLKPIIGPGTSFRGLQAPVIRAIARIYKQQKLDQVVVDKCHIVLQ